MYAVLRGYATREKRGAAGRTHGDGDKEIVEANTRGGNAVEIGGANFWIAITSGSPRALIIGEHKDDVGGH